MDGGRAVRKVRGSGGAVVFAPDGRTVASISGHTLHHQAFMGGSNVFGAAPEPDEAVRLWEALSGQVVLKRRFASATAAAFAPGGRTLAWGDADGGLHLWDLGPEVPLADAESLEKLWNDLASEDAATAFQAVWTMAALGPAAVRLLKDRVQPATVDEGRLAQLLTSLDSDRFAVREAAMRELERFGLDAEPALRQAVDRKQLSAEARRRAELILKGLYSSKPPPATVRSLRAIAVLERIGSAESRRVLLALAQGAPSSPLTREAKQVLERWQR
jgi:hypothetical protein